MQARISIKREIIQDDETVIVDDTEIVKVDHIVSAGILLDESAADETLDVLIPWHRVWEVYSHHKGVLLFETRGN